MSEITLRDIAPVSAIWLVDKPLHWHLPFMFWGEDSQHILGMYGTHPWECAERIVVLKNLSKIRRSYPKWRHDMHVTLETFVSVGTLCLAFCVFWCIIGLNLCHTQLFIRRKFRYGSKFLKIMISNRFSTSDLVVTSLSNCGIHMQLAQLGTNKKRAPSVKLTCQVATCKLIHRGRALCVCINVSVVNIF